ncbi:glucose signaling factor 2-domain-containing protein [Kockiozyma suomiensis]|uniref:glucose signaling factor 2-domain-containing protein n=1 Tax=Kockiozyma suomiensis TaxID=1337062 RepID=UPI003343469B
MSDSPPPAPEGTAKKDKLIDIYVRLNGDSEKDYCFCLPREEPVSILHSIFDTLPLVLSPTFFYQRKPSGFHLSTSPGFVTSEGALLFEHSGKLTPLDESKRISDIVREGQLFVPIFKYNKRRFFTVVALLLFWLYTDLPEWFTPTPGISLFALCTKAYDHFFAEIPDPNAPEPEAEPADGTVDVVFFVFHFLKCLVIFLIFFFGGYNPTSMNPFYDAPDVSADQLRAIGWTGARRITPDEWREENRKRKIEEVGGAVKAYEKGILLGLGTAGVSLRAGEGFDTPWDYVRPETAILPEPPAAAVVTTANDADKSEETVAVVDGEATTTSSDVAKTVPVKPAAAPQVDPLDTVDLEAVLFRLSTDYEDKLTKYRRSEISRRMKLGDTVAVALKDWRRIGPLVPPAREVELQYSLRKRLENRPDLFVKTMGSKKND